MIAIFWLWGIMELTDDEAEEISRCDCSSSVRLEDIDNAELERSMVLTRRNRRLRERHHA
jgi:hypothetical protein